MKLNFIKKVATMLLISVVALFQSCSSSDATVKVGASGFFIVNEGSFGAGNSSISYYDRKADAVTNDVFFIKNGRKLGDQAQSMTVFENKGYIIVQNSSKVEVINADDFSSIGSITDLPSPRYFVGISSTKGYVSDWGTDGFTGTIKVIDLTTLTVTKTIATGKGANRMLKINNLVYVTNNGGYGNDNTIKVIDSTTDGIVATITTGDNPNSIQKDKDGNLWVASGGIMAYNTTGIDEVKTVKGSISKIGSNNTEVFKLIVDKATYSTPANLGISPDGATLYYTYNGAIYQMATSATALPTTAFKTKSYYGMAIDSFNGNVIGTNATNFSSAGMIDVYDASGNLKSTYTAGIGPNGCAFK